MTSGDWVAGCDYVTRVAGGWCYTAFAIGSFAGAIVG
jgi:hypothetical protein